MYIIQKNHIACAMESVELPIEDFYQINLTICNLFRTYARALHERKGECHSPLHMVFKG